MKAAGAGLRRAARNDGQVGEEERNDTEWELEAWRRSQQEEGRKKDRQKLGEEDQTEQTRVVSKRQKCG